VLEQISHPGVAHLFESIIRRDFADHGIMIVVAFTIVLANLRRDVMYAYSPAHRFA
jgi:ABC-type dipeptide/oligopeptide/nickel transport system permease component